MAQVLQTELENPLNVHRWRRLEGKDPETLELIQAVDSHHLSFHSADIILLWDMMLTTGSRKSITCRSG